MPSLSGGLNDRRRDDLASCKVKENASNKLIISYIYIYIRAYWLLGHYFSWIYSMLSFNFGHYIPDNVSFMLSTTYSTNYSQPVLHLFEKVVNSYLTAVHYTICLHSLCQFPSIIEYNNG